MANHRIFHIEIDEESDYVAQFIFQDPTTNLPIPLSGYRAEMQVRPGINSDFSGYNGNVTPIVLNTDTSAIVVGATDGSITVTIPYSATYNLNWDKAVYDVFLMSPIGKRLKFAAGFLTVIPSATRMSNSTLVAQSGSGSTPSPNNLGAQGQDSNDPLVDPTIIPPEVVQPDAIQILQAQIDAWSTLTLMANL